MFWLKRIALILLALLSIAAAGTGWLTTQSLPQNSGTAALEGPAETIEVLRDTHGIPTIRAENEGDAYFALGYVHAQDRLFQMDFMRRLGAGRLSEVLGAQALGSDRFMRTLGLYHSASANVSSLAPATLNVLQRYADGVNAWLANRSGPLPPEFQVLNYTPEPWQPADSLVWQKIMGLSLAGNWRDELLRSRLLKLLPPERVAELWPDYQPGTPTTLTDAQTIIPTRLASHLIEHIDAYAPPTLASNIWVLDGQHTQSGKPILASDPHLGYQVPLVWYLARLEWPGEVRSGATTPGFPFTVIGHNGHVAWGMTTTHADLQDLFIERVTGNGHYLTPDGPANFEIRTETIDVRFADSVSLDIRMTRHGPVVSDLTAFGGDENGDAATEETVLALSSTLLNARDRTANAVLAIGYSRTVEHVKAALSQFEGPQQNFMYADTNGGIGFSAAAHVPVRAGGDGTVPVPGWSGAYDWVSRVPYDDLPHILNPASGRLVNANNRPVPPEYPHLIAATFPAGYRAERIEQRLDALALAPANPSDMVAIQTDAVSAMAIDLLPILLDLVEAPGGQAAQVVALLQSWDGHMSRDQPGPLLFLSWLDFIGEELLKDELGGSYRSFRGDPVLIKSILTSRQHWCDNVSTVAIETCAAVVLEALDRSLTWLNDREETSGDDPGTWRWGDFHRARFSHPLFGLIPGLAAATTVEIEVDGGDHTVNRGGFRSARGRTPFINTHGAGLRAVFDLANLDQSLFMIAVGQSGHPVSPYYRDLNVVWRDGGTLTLPGTQAFSSDRRLTLVPLAKPDNSSYSSTQ